MRSRWSFYRQSLRHGYSPGPVALDFLSIAPPKVGTTWLFFSLRHAPQFYLPYKEHHQFSLHWRTRSFFEYDKNFSNKPEGSLAGDITPSYGILPASAVRAIHELAPNLRLICVLRDPIERAWCHARHHFKMNEGAFFDRPYEEIADVSDEFWIFDLLHPASRIYNDYIAQLQPWVEVFGAERIHVGFFEDLVRAPKEFLMSIYQFLGAGNPDSFPEFPTGEHRGVGIPWPMTDGVRKFLESLLGSQSRRVSRYLAKTFGIESVPWSMRPRVLAPPDPQALFALWERLNDSMFRQEGPDGLPLSYNASTQRIFGRLFDTARVRGALPATLKSNALRKLCLDYEALYFDR